METLIIDTIGDAKGLSQSPELTPAQKEIVLNVANLAESQLNAVMLSEKLEAERVITLDSLRENFADASKDDVLKVLDKVNECLSEIVRRAIAYDNARIATEKMLESDDDITDAEMDEQSDKETAAGQSLIDVIKALHNSAHEEGPAKEDGEQSEDTGSED